MSVRRIFVTMFFVAFYYFFPADAFCIEPVNPNLNPAAREVLNCHNEWIYVDLGQVYSISRLNLLWGGYQLAAFEVPVCSKKADSIPSSQPAN